MSAPAVADANRPFGENTFEAGRSPLSPLRATLALWWLATKRNGGLLMLPVIAGVMGWLVRDQHSWRAVILWMPTVQGIAYTLVVAGPLTAALAAWVAGASRRRKTTDLLATVPLPTAWRTLADWLGVTAWAVGCYLVSAAVALGWTATQATWGGPLLWPIGIAATGLAVCAALGLLLGSLWPSRFLPPVLAVAVGFLIVAPTGIQQLARVKLLSPLGAIDSVVREPLVEVDLRMMVPHLRWLAALGLVCILTLIVRQGGGWLARGLLAASMVAAVVAAGPLLDYRDRGWGGFGYEPLPYTPVCATATVTVCVHPAYQAFLKETELSVELIVAPLAGIGGVPTRFEQTVIGEQSSDIVYLYLYNYEVDTLAHIIGYDVSREIVIDWGAIQQPANVFTSGVTAAQAIVGEWLRLDYQKRAGLHDSGSFYGAPPGAGDSLVLVEMVVEGAPFQRCTADPEESKSMICDDYDYDAATGTQAQIDAATDRFLTLDPATRRAWLQANWTRLRSGLVTLKEMP